MRGRQHEATKRLNNDNKASALLRLTTDPNPFGPAGGAGTPFGAASAKPAGLPGGRPERHDGQAVQCLRRVRDVPPLADHPPGPAHLRRHPRQGQRHAARLAQRVSLIFTTGGAAAFDIILRFYMWALLTVINKRITGGAMQLSFSSITLDYYPFHRAGQNSASSPKHQRHV